MSKSVTFDAEFLTLYVYKSQVKSVFYCVFFLNLKVIDIQQKKDGE